MVDRSSPPPQPVAYVRDLLRGLEAPWFLCGGWAADAWLGGRTRGHGDVDIAVFHHDQPAIFAHFPGWAMVAHDPNVPDDTTDQWTGRRLDLPAHIHVPVRRSPLATSPARTHSAVEFEFLLNERSAGDWVLNREPYVAVPLERATRPSPWGLPAATPEVILFYKAGLHQAGDPARPQDEQDFHALLPILTGAQRSWLRESLGTVHPAHPWLAQV